MYLLQMKELKQRLTPNGTTLLRDAAKNGQLDVVQLLLDQGANIEAEGNRGYTPLTGAL